MQQVIVKVKFFAHFAQLVGQSELEKEVTNDLNKAIREIDQAIRIPLWKELSSQRAALLLNGRGVSLVEDIKLKDNDVLAFLPIMGGG